MIDLYYSPTPNGRKISILLEELEIDYKVILIDLNQNEQFTDKFSRISPTNKIPVIVDKDNGNTVFESGAILLYLSNKYNRFVNKTNYWEIIQWVFFQMSYVGPMLGQAHQYLYYHAGKSKFASERSRNYAKHVYSILDKRLSVSEYFSDDYSIADISIWPWVARFERHEIQIDKYPNVLKWYLKILKRPAVVKGYNIAGEFHKIPVP